MTIDIQALVEEAQTNVTHESFRVIKKSANFRIGVGARMESPKLAPIFLEVLFSLCGDPAALDLDSLQRGLILLRELRRRGYSLKCEEGGDISGEIQVTPLDLEVEIETIESLIAGYEKVQP